MSLRALAVASLCALGVIAHPFAHPAGAAPAPGPDPARFAIVIGNNRPERASAGVLRFADDDALATHRLLGEAGVRSVLLARLDDTTQKLHPGAATDGLPRWDDLRAALAGLEREMLRERAANREVELLVFYSGHGDVEHGEGYVLLEDRHLTRGDLAAILERSPATRNHVIIDACKSYFMAFEKGPGGRRTRFTSGFVDPAAASARHLANTGFVLSTSSDRDSHEWERFGGGVFSHQVRSALRGAADVDHDGRISYAELGAFLTTASAAIPNPRFRPDFLVRPAAGAAARLSETLLAWDARAVSTVVVDHPSGRPSGHVYVETAAGERVLDAHTAASEPATLHVPEERPLFVRSDDGSGRESVVRTEGAVTVSGLEDQPISVARRGAAHLAFEQLFALPFGRDSVRRFVAEWTDEPARSGDPRDDDPPASPARAAVSTALGATAVASGALAVVVSAVMLERFEVGKSAAQLERDRTNQTLRQLGIASAILGAVAVASGAAWFGVHRWWTGQAPPDGDTQVLVLPSAGGLATGATLVIERAW